METNLKRCIKCGEYKPLDQFSKDKTSKDGLKCYCKDCVHILTKEYRGRHLPDILARRREYWQCQPVTRLTAEADKAGERTCPACGETKPVSEFYRRKSGNLYSRCKACERAAQKEFRASNREHVLEQSRQYNQNKRLGITKPKPEPPTETPEEMHKRLLSRRVVMTPELAKEREAIYRHRREARKASLPRTLTVEEWKACKEFFGNRCAYCGKELKLEQEHVIPLVKGGPYTKDNIIPACRFCNCSKRDREVWDWYRINPNYSEERELKIREYLSSMSTP